MTNRPAASPRLVSLNQSRRPTTTASPHVPIVHVESDAHRHSAQNERPANHPQERRPSLPRPSWSGSAENRSA